MGMSQVLESRTVLVYLNPNDTEPKSISSQLSVKDGPTTCPRKSSVRGREDPTTSQRNVSANSPSVSDKKRHWRTWTVSGATVPLEGWNSNMRPKKVSGRTRRNSAGTSPRLCSSTCAARGGGVLVRSQGMPVPQRTAMHRNEDAQLPQLLPLPLKEPDAS